MKSRIPLFFYPAQIVFIDDNPDFLASLEMIFASDFNLKLFDDTTQALAYINAPKPDTQRNHKKNTPELSGDSDKWVKKVLNHSHLKGRNNERDMEISVVVADFSMPGLNGIELCKKITNPAIKKILLTGHATPSDAVNAFNENIIHYYIKKSDDNMLEQLTNAINKLQNAYFQDLTSHIKAEAVEVNTPFFADAQLAEYFQNVCTELDVKEYFYLPNPSRFTLQTRDNNELLCLIYTEEDIAEHLKILEEEDAPADLIQRIGSRNFIPLFNSEDGFYEPESFNHSVQLYPAERVAGKTNYYCAVIPQRESAAAPATITPIANRRQLH
uniref:response regulator n=1 Tax=Cellvibrio fontiphilus TaxID=1815559 RepID=UPI002B4BA599|nr:response regulator [Cellvibrio fontiphilus]